MDKYNAYCSAILLGRLHQIKDGMNNPHISVQQHDLLKKEMKDIKEELRIRGYTYYTEL